MRAVAEHHGESPQRLRQLVAGELLVDVQLVVLPDDLRQQPVLLGHAGVCFDRAVVLAQPGLRVGQAGRDQANRLEHVERVAVLLAAGPELGQRHVEVFG